MKLAAAVSPPRALLLLTILLSLAPAQARAAWPSDPSTNVAVVAGAGAQTAPVATTDGAGGAIVAWIDRRYADLPQIFAQRVRATGVVDPAWPGGGRAVALAANSTTFTPELAIISDGAGGALIAWQSGTASGEVDIRVHRILANGTLDPTWPAGGVNTDGVPQHHSRLAMTSDGSGGALVLWSDSRLCCTDLFAQHVLPNGTTDPAWTADGKLVSDYPGTKYDIRMVPDGGGGFYVVFSDFYAPNYCCDWPLVLTRHHLANGDPAPGWYHWGNGLAGGFDYGVGQPAIAADGVGGALLAWVDGRDHRSEIYAQRLDGSGASLWPLYGRQVTSGASSEHTPGIVHDLAGGAVVCWADQRSGNADIYGSHVLSSGAIDPLVPAGGSPICVASGDQIPIGFVPDGIGGAIVVWTDLRSGVTDVYAHHLRADGTADPTWPANGRAVCTATGAQVNVTAVTDGGGGAIVAWQDPRNGNNDIYAQNVNFNGTIGGDGPTATVVSLVSAEYADGVARIAWQVSGDALQGAVIQRHTESEGWRQVGQAIADGVGRIVYEDREVVAGRRYGFRLAMGDVATQVFLGEAWIDVPAERADLWLSRPVPNPTSREAIIRFGLPDDDHVSLVVHDSQGRRVRTLGSERMSAGEHVLRWDLANDGGAHVASGVYFARLTVSGVTKTVRVAVLD